MIAARLGASLVVLLSLVAGGEAKELAGSFRSLYAERSLPPPQAGRMVVCYGFVCRRRAEIAFTAADRDALARILARGRNSAAAERAAVAEAVGWFDRRLGPLLGTAQRVPRADFRQGDDAHNFDCIDTALNTTSFLLLLEEWDLLRHHRVDMPRFRGNVLIGQTPHNTAVLIERHGGQGWAVDMWTVGYGAPADVMPVERWLQEN